MHELMFCGSLVVKCASRARSDIRMYLVV